jgi:hypothetical protein
MKSFKGSSNTSICLLLVLRFLGKQEAAEHYFHCITSYCFIQFFFTLHLTAVHVPENPPCMVSSRRTNYMPCHDMSEYSCYCLTKHVLLSFLKKKLKLKILSSFGYLKERPEGF